MAGFDRAGEITIHANETEENIRIGESPQEGPIRSEDHKRPGVLLLVKNPNMPLYELKLMREE